MIRITFLTRLANEVLDKPEQLVRSKNMPSICNSKEQSEFISSLYIDIIGARAESENERKSKNTRTKIVRACLRAHKIYTRTKISNYREMCPSIS